MKLYVGDHVGQIKEISLNGTTSDVKLIFGKVDKNESIIAMTLVDVSFIVCTVKGKRIIILNAKTGVVERSISGFEDELLGIFANTQCIVTVTKNGCIYYFPFNESCTQVDEYLKLSSSKRIEVGRQLETFSVHPQLNNFIAVGGKDIDLLVFDVNGSKPNEPVFRSKMYSTDNVGLPVVSDSSAIIFIDHASPNHLLVGTTQHKIRLYDTKKQRRALSETKLGSHAVSSMALRPKSTQVVISTVAGDVFIFDHKTNKIIGKCKGNLGSVTFVQCHPTLPLLLTCGVDHYARIFDLDSREMCFELYVKQKLTGGSWSSEDVGFASKRKYNGDSVTATEEYESIWDNMKTVRTITSAKRSKRQ